MATLTSIQKATQLLFFLNAQPGPCGVSKIAAELSLPKSSAHRLLQALRFRDLVRQDERGLYELGVGLVALGLGASRSDPLVRVARPFLVASAGSVGETFFLVGERASELVVLDKAEGAGVLRISPQVGAHVPVHATAVGRLYLAFAPERVFVDESRLRVFTDRTVKTPETLRKSVAIAKEQGVSVSNEEWIEGLSAVAAPISCAGRLLGAVVVACVSARFRELGAPALSRAARRTAESISKALEGSP